MSKRKRVSADPQGVQTRYLEKVVILVKSDRSAATENTCPTVQHFTPTPLAKPLLELRRAQCQVLSMISIQI
jgi:hypothetical protein